MKSILQLCSSQFTYTRFVEPIASHLLSSGFSVSAAFGSSDGLPSSINSSIPFYPIDIPRSFSIPRYFKAAISLKRLSNTHAFSHIHCHTPSAALVARLSRLLGSKSKIVYTVHGFYFHEGMNFLNRFVHITIEFLLSFLTHSISCVSYEDFAFTTRYLPFSKRSVFYIPNSVDHSSFYDAVSPVSDSFIPEAPIKLGFAGRLVNEKGLRELLHALFILMTNSPHITFTLCGSALPSDRDPIDTHLLDIFYTSFPDRFFVLGMLRPDEMPSFYRSIDYLILPSYREGLPTVLIEAMMSGTPCLASSIRGCRELVIRSSPSFLFQSRSTSSLLSCLKRVLTFHPFYQSFSGSAISSVYPYFSSVNVLPQYTQLFNS